MSDSKGLLQLRIKNALEMAMLYGDVTGSVHKMWVIDQMVRALTGCEREQTKRLNFKSNKEYEKFIACVKIGDDGPDTYDWDYGLPP